MRILLVSATDLEIAPILSQLEGASSAARFTSGMHSGHSVDVLVTGVGMVATASRCAQALARNSYGLAVNVGVCGSFDPALTPGHAVHVISDRMAELGAEDGDAFLTMQEVGLLGDDEFPYTGGELVNARPPVNPALEALPAVAGITVNTVHGNARSIAAVTARFKPAVESMEGAGFMYACLIAGVPFAQVRAVSNMVERRNRESWNLPLAVESLGRTTTRLLELA
jgi:futalosine hydrolase